MYGSILISIRSLLATLFILSLLSCSGGSSGGNSGGGGGAPPPQLSGTTGGLGPVISYSSFGSLIHQVLIGDFNGDGRNDVVTLSNQDPRVVIYYQGPVGTFDQADNMDPPINNQIDPKRLAVGDLNGDGKDDLVISGNTVGNANVGLLVFYQDPVQGVLLPGIGFPLTTGFSAFTSFPIIGDIDSDGKNDLVLSTPDQQLIIRYQQPNGGLGPETIYDKFPVFQGLVYIADMDNDGDNDLVVMSGHKEVAIIKQDSSAKPSTLKDRPDRYAIQTSYWTDSGPFAVGDLNNDGKNDLIVTDPGNSGLINLFLQNNGGTLSPAIILPQPFIPWGGVLIGDMNRDGLNDILSASVDAGFPAQANTWVMYQSSAHTFSPVTPYSFPTQSGGGGTVGFAVGDVTGDGKPDAVIAWQSEGLFVMPNTFR